MSSCRALFLMEWRALIWLAATDARHRLQWCISNQTQFGALRKVPAVPQVLASGCAEVVPSRDLPHSWPRCPLIQLSIETDTARKVVNSKCRRWPPMWLNGASAGFNQVEPLPLKLSFCLIRSKMSASVIIIFTKKLPKNFFTHKRCFS